LFEKDKKYGDWGLGVGGCGVGGGGGGRPPPPHRPPPNTPTKKIKKINI